MSNTSRIMQAAAAGVPGTKWTVDNVKTNFRPLGQVELASNGQQVAWHPDGTYFYQVQRSNVAAIRSYFSPSGAWETQPFGAAFGSASVEAQDTEVYGVAFKDDGTKMFVTGAQNSRVYEYTLSTAWDPSTLSFVRSYNLGWGSDKPASIVIGNNGTRMVISRNGGTDAVYSYNLNTAWSLSSVSFTGSFSISDVWGVALNTTGTQLFVGSSLTRDYQKYDVPVAWRMSSLTLNTTFNDDDWYANGSTQVPDLTIEALHISFKPDGTKMFLRNSVAGLYNYDLSTPYVFSSATRQLAAAEYYKWPGTQTRYSYGKQGLAFNNRGTSFYVTDTWTDTIDQYDLSVPYDITTASYAAQLDNVVPPADTWISRDGDLLFSCSGDSIKKYTLSTPFDISTATLTATTALSPTIDMTGLFFRDDGLKVYATANGSAYQWTLATAFDLTTATADGSASIVLSSGGAFTSRVPVGVRFDNTGTKLLTIERRSSLFGGLSAVYINAFTLSVPWDVTSGFSAPGTQYAGITSDLGGNGGNGPRGFGVSPDGSYVFVPILGQDILLQYTLK